MNIDQKKLSELHRYFTVDKGSTKLEDVMKKIGTTDEAVVDAYKEVLREKYPHIYGSKKKEEVPAPTPIAAEIKKVTLLDPETNLGEELEIVAQGNGKLVVKKIIPPEPKDEVTLKLKGEDVVVDLIQLRKLDKNAQKHGTTVGNLITLAELAR